MPVIMPRDPCPECDKEGFITTLRLRSIESTDEPVEGFRKGGDYHIHDDVNEYLYTFECSLGHIVQDQRTGKPCVVCGWLPPERQVQKEVAEVEALGIIVSVDEGQLEW